MTIEWWFQVVKDGGAVAAVLELGALLWLNIDRNRLLNALMHKDTLLKEKDDKLASLSERTLVLLAEVKTFLFHGGRPA